MDESQKINADHSLPKQETASARRRWGVILAWVFVLGLLAILGVGLIRTQEGPIGVGAEVPDLTLTTFGGEEIRLADLEDQVVLINFWASWCKPCEQEAAELEQAYQEYKDRGIVFLGVDYVDTEPEALAYLEKFGISYPNGPDLGTRISQAFRIRGVPETYIVGRDGRIGAVKIGPYLSLAEIRGQLDRVLAGE
jgi:cytochrome c biogenesis protein CcmG/thiol:disulfide interchange protein DsbE